MIQWLGIIALAINIGSITYHCVRLRKLFRSEKASHDLARYAFELDGLLTFICLQAYKDDHQKIWHAWAAVMGDIQIEVTANRKPD